MPLETIGLPRVKTFTHVRYGSAVVLECLCGELLPYPGVNGAPNPIACKRCDQHFAAVAPETLREQVVIEQ